MDGIGHGVVDLQNNASGAVFAVGGAPLRLTAGAGSCCVGEMDQVRLAQLGQGFLCDLADVASAYTRHITGNVRSPRRALDGFSNYPQITNVIAKLTDRGYTDQDISNILGENYLRVFGQVWR